MSDDTLMSTTTGELLGHYAGILAELRRRGVVRTGNAPAGDYAEWLISKVLGGELATNRAEKSYDVLAPGYGQVQVKARVVSDPPRAGQLQTSAFRSWDFAFAAFVLLHETDYAVIRAVLLPVVVVRQLATRRAHVNGWVVHMTSAVLDHPQAEDLKPLIAQETVS